MYPLLFERIHDHHGYLTYKGKIYKWKSPTTSEIAPNIKAALNRKPAVRAVALTKKVGYLLIPGNSDFRGTGMDSITKAIKDAIANVNSPRIKSWIIDLRLNDGGNMYPMIAGIGQLLGTDGKIGGFTAPNGQSDGEWRLKNGSFHVDSVRVSAVPTPGYQGRSDLPIAVLIGSGTASSGEMTAISTIGRARTTLLGEPSAGYTTVNTGFELNKNSGLVLAVDYANDRNGVLYPDRLQPAIVVMGGDNFENLKQDSKIRAALKWLKKKA